MSAVRTAGLKRAMGIAVDRTWSESISFGLASDLRDLPEPRPAKIPVYMTPVDAQGFGGFAEELPRVDGDDTIEVMQRLRMCEGGVGRLYVARTDDGDAIYAQWLVDHAGQDPLHRVTHGIFPVLGPGETLVEGAYTFVRFRKLGAMAVGMHELLEAARDGGSHTCLTYVTTDNVPSLRGCANVGFVPDHVRETRWRFGRRTVRFRAPTPAERATWDVAVAPKPARAAATS